MSKRKEEKEEGQTQATGTTRRRAHISRVPGGLHPVGSQGVEHNWEHTHTGTRCDTFWTHVFLFYFLLTNLLFYLFIWLLWLLVVAHGIFNLHCSLWDLDP